MIRLNSTRAITFCALFTALTAICSQIQIPLSLIPISLSLLAVHLSGSLLGPTGGFISQATYLLLGAAGLPIFAGFQGGPGSLVGPTGGYLIGYLVAAWVDGFLIKKWGKQFYQVALSMLIGTLACYTFGTIWYIIYTHTGVVPALAACVFPFLPGDILKILLASFLTLRLRGPLCRILT